MMSETQIEKEIYLLDRLKENPYLVKWLEIKPILNIGASLEKQVVIREKQISRYIEELRVTEENPIQEQPQQQTLKQQSEQQHVKQPQQRVQQPQEVPMQAHEVIIEEDGFQEKTPEEEAQDLFGYDKDELGLNEKIDGLPDLNESDSDDEKERKNN